MQQNQAKPKCRESIKLKYECRLFYLKPNATEWQLILAQWQSEATPWVNIANVKTAP